MKLTEEESSLIAYLIHRELYGRELRDDEDGSYWQVAKPSQFIRVGQEIAKKLQCESPATTS